MKYYEIGTHLKEPYKLDKNYIKESIKPILLNCLKEFGVDIDEWHYIFCIYYNPKIKNSYNKSLVNNCNKYDIEYILYDPNEETFYSRNFIPIQNRIELNYRSNLESLSSSNPYNIFINNDLFEYFSNQRFISSNEANKSDQIFELKKEDALDKLKIAINKHFELVCKYIYNPKFSFPIPQNNYLLLFKGNEENNYIYYYNNNNVLICGNLLNNVKYKAGFISNYVDNKNDNIILYVFINKKE